MPEENGGASRGHVLFAWSPNGYLLRELDGDPPAVGSEFDVEGHLLVVTKLGASPLPGDSRPCVFASGR